MDQPYQPAAAPAPMSPTTQAWPPPWTATDQPQWPTEATALAVAMPTVPQQINPQPIMQQPINVNVNVQQAAPMPIIIVAPTSSGPGFLVRAVWFLFVGFWLGGVAIYLAYALALTVIGLPLTFAIFDKIGAIMTLRGRSKTLTAQVVNGATIVSFANAPQLAFWQRALYFLTIGWWASLFSVTLGYVLCLTILGLPLGLMLLNATGAIMTLQKN